MKNEPASGVSQLSKNDQFPAQNFQKIQKCQNKIDKSIKANLNPLKLTFKANYMNKPWLKSKSGAPLNPHLNKT